MTEFQITERKGPLFATGLLLLVVGLLLLVGGAIAAAPGVDAADPDANETEQRYEEPVPERGDRYFEAEDPDGNWISYVNPRDEYRSPYLGDGSGKICVTLRNEDGEVAVGETVPNTTIVVPTGESIEWHSSADPIAVDLPLTDHYDRPLDADQFGTSSEVPQGDGYLDSHCVEFHGLPDDERIEYGEATVEGEFADRIRVVGYVQQANDAWDTDVDPFDDAKSYDEAGGGWTYEPGGSHGQVVIVLHIEASTADGGDDVGDDANDESGADGDDGGGDDADSGEGDAADDTDDKDPDTAESLATAESGDPSLGRESTETTEDGATGSDATETDDDPTGTGFAEGATGFGASSVGVLAAVLLLISAAVVRVRP